MLICLILSLLISHFGPWNPEGQEQRKDRPLEEAIQRPPFTQGLPLHGSSTAKFKIWTSVIQTRERERERERERDLQINHPAYISLSLNWRYIRNPLARYTLFLLY